MGRIRNLKLSALNIVQHPHNKKLYIELFKEAAINAKPVKIFGQYYGLLSKIEVNEKEGYIFGKFYRFTEINKDQPWLDLNNANQILDEDGKAVQIVEDHIKPNSKEIYFYFVIKNHRLVFDNNYIAANSIKSFFENLFISTHFSVIKSENITITIEQSEESLEEILKLYHINQIDLLISRPNPDDFGSLEKTIKDRLENMEADEYEQIIKSKTTGLKPDSELKQLMKVARSNGKVDVKGRDESGKSIIESTELHPLEVISRYNDDEETYLDALKNRTFIVVGNIMEKLKK